MVSSLRREEEGGESRWDAVSVVLMRGPESNVKCHQESEGDGEKAP